MQVGPCIPVGTQQFQEVGERELDLADAEHAVAVLLLLLQRDVHGRVAVAVLAVDGHRVRVDQRLHDVPRHKRAAVLLPAHRDLRRKVSPRSACYICASQTKLSLEKLSLQLCITSTLDNQQQKQPP